MKIREYISVDLESIQKLTSADYTVPQFDHPWMIIRRVLTDDDDRIVAAAFGRIHVNALLFVDHSWGDPAARLEAVKMIQEDMIERAADLGLDIATTQMEGRFAERMKELGWIRGWGDLYYHEIQNNKSSSKK
jgi:hypothetical protein